MKCNLKGVIKPTYKCNGCNQCCTKKKNTCGIHIDLHVPIKPIYTNFTSLHSITFFINLWTHMLQQIQTFSYGHFGIFHGGSKFWMTQQLFSNFHIVIYSGNMKRHANIISFLPSHKFCWNYLHMILLPLQIH